MLGYTVGSASDGRHGGCLVINVIAVAFELPGDHVSPVDSVPIVTIGWLVPECQSGLWSVLSNATVYCPWILTVA